MGRFLSIFIASYLLVSLPLFAVDSPSGEALYQKRCAACHDQPSPRIPPRAALENLYASRILRVMNSGAMMTIAYTLKRDEKEAVAAYLGKPGEEPGPPPAAFCKDRAVKVDTSAKLAWNGWSPTVTNTRLQPAAVAGLSIDQVKGLKLKWAYAFEGDISAYAQPAVIGGQVFVGSASGAVQALRADTGCLEWVYQAAAPVRTAISVAPLGKRHAVIFGDQTGAVYAVEAESGELLWKKKVEEHEAALLTGAPTVFDGVAYVPVASWEETRSINPQYPCCTFRGSVVALRIRDGFQIWKTYTITETPRELGKTSVGTPRWGPSGAGVWGAPTVDAARKLLYVATGDNYSPPATAGSDSVMALELANGRVAWSRQVTANDAFNSACVSGVNGPNCPEGSGPDFDFGSSVILAKTPSRRDLLLAGQKSGMIYALDPDRNGELVWQTRVGKGGVIGGVQWGMASDGQNLYAATSDAIFVQKNGVRSLDPAAGGGLTALRLADGDKSWYVPPVACTSAPGCSPAQSSAVTAIPGVVFSGSMDGHLRAYSSEDGKVLWDFNTVREFTAVNGVKAQGGALDGPGPVVVNGMVFVNSGYARFGGAPGNVLLAFEP
ncbi:MAG TPA: PQQ-binding-like beta-propeller repeat protein [Bryobacteraceae bacterium]|nr:PQQ-binding-like beta-propeller repeat protein [Bryobacteraceae bacterium]